VTTAPGPGWHIGQQLVEHVLVELTACETTREAFGALDPEEREAVTASTLKLAVGLVNGAVERETARLAETTNLALVAVHQLLVAAPRCMQFGCFVHALWERRVAGWPVMHACDDPEHRRSDEREQPGVWSELPYAAAVRAVAARL